MIRRPPRSTRVRSSAASDVYKRQQAKCRIDGWSNEDTWAIENLQLMHKICNAKKSDRTYDASGMLSRKGPVRVIKAARPDWCDLCDSGRLLYPGEFCPDCESGAQ